MTHSVSQSQDLRLSVQHRRTIKARVLHIHSADRVCVEHRGRRRRISVTTVTACSVRWLSSGRCMKMKGTNRASSLNLVAATENDQSAPSVLLAYLYTNNSYRHYLCPYQFCGFC